VLGYNDHQAAGYLTLYYVFTAVMGMISVLILRYVKAHLLTGIYGISMVLLIIISMLFNTGYNQFILAGLGIFLSIMFPTLFSLAIEDIGTFTNKGSALLNFAIIGGSVFPPIQGMIADANGVQVSYLVPLVCCIMITIYAFVFTKEGLKKSRTINEKREIMEPVN
jgi:FHS family L-fucose permease-like MFS transporter